MDDEEVVRNTAQAALVRYRYSVLTAEDGQRAVDLFRERADEVTVVLLDMTMPVMDGEEAFRLIRMLRSNARGIISSGYNEVEAIRRFTAKGIRNPTLRRGKARPNREAGDRNRRGKGDLTARTKKPDLRTMSF